MARYYYLLMAFSERDAAIAAECSFAQLQLPLAGLGQLACVTNTWPTYEDIWLVSAHPIGVSLGVAGDSPQITSTDQLDEIAKQLYRQLRQVEGYISAIAGWEVAELFMIDAHSSYRDLHFTPEVFAGTGWNGLVIQETMWTSMNAPVEFEPFKRGYVWRPYRTLGVSGW